MISRCGVIPAASCRSSLGSGILLACASRGRCSFPKVTRFVVRLKLLELVTLMIVQRGCMRGCIPRPTSYTSSKVTAPDITDFAIVVKLPLQVVMDSRGTVWYWVSLVCTWTK